MTTAHLAIRNAVADALEAWPALSGVPVKRGRSIPLTLTESSAVFVNLRHSPAQAANMAGTVLQWSTTITASVVARGAVGQDAETALDPLLAATWDAIAAMTTPSGAAKVAPGDIRFEVDEAERCIGVATLAITFTHITTGAGLTA